MTSNDKTGDKLVQSIRKTKAAGSTARDRTTSAKGAGTRKATAKAAAKPAARKTASRAPEPAAAPVDPYQSGRRVWPD